MSGERRLRYKRPLHPGSSKGGDHKPQEALDDDDVVLLLGILIVVVGSVAPPWSVVILVVAALLEVVEVVFLRRWARRLDRRTVRTTGSEAMVGERAEVVDACHPRGTVQLNGELWEATCEGGAEAGETVRVKSVEGLTLVVAR